MNFWQKTLEERKSECRAIMHKFPHRVPVIVAPTKSSKLPPLESFKFLIPDDKTGAQLIAILRSKWQLESTQGIFCYVQTPGLAGALKYECLPPCVLMSQLYEQFKDPQDGFLYVLYEEESTFG